jgi:hypothetical protein
MPERFDSAVSSVGVSATGAGAGVGAGEGDLVLGFDFDFRGALSSFSTTWGCVSTCSGFVSFFGDGGASSWVVVYVEGRLGRMSSPACCNCFAYSFLSFAFSIRLRLIWMAVRGECQRVGLTDMGGACYSLLRRWVPSGRFWGPTVKPFLCFFAARSADASSRGRFVIAIVWFDVLGVIGR